MGVRFVLGGAGTGKTTYMFKEVLREAELHRDKKYFIFVPEQFTLQTQRDIVLMSERHGIGNIDVLSFNRLFHRVNAESGKGVLPVLKDDGKSMIMRLVLSKLKDELSLYGRKASQAGFVELSKSMMSELKQYGIAPSDLEKMAAELGDESVLGKKLSEISLIYKRYNEFLEGHYLTSEGIFDDLAEKLDNFADIKGSVLVFDGFTGFTPSEYGLLSKLIRISESATFAFTFEDRDSRYLMSQDALKVIRELAQEAHVPVLEPVYLSERKRYHNEELKVLQERLFKFGASPYDGKNSHIHIQTATDIRSECVYAATLVSELIARRGYRYRDITIICGDDESYREPLKLEFAKSGIPVFIDANKTMSENVFTDLIDTVTDMVTSGYRKSAVLKYIRNVFADWSENEICLVDGYCIKAGVRDFGFLKPWVKKTGYTDDEITKLESLRRKVFDETEILKKAFSGKDKTVREYCEAFREFFAENDMELRLSDLSEELKSEGDILRAREYGEAFRVFTELTDELIVLLGDEVMDIRTFMEILDAGLAEAKVGLIPEGSDYIVVCNTRRSRIKETPVILFMGLNEGVYPTNGESINMLSTYERRKLESLGITLKPSKNRKAVDDRFYFLSLLSKATDDIYLSYYLSSNDASGQLPSSFLNAVTDVFKTCPAAYDDPDRMKYLLNDNGKSSFLKQLSEYSIREEFYDEEMDMLAESFAWYREHLPECDFGRYVETVFGKEKEVSIGSELASELYDRNAVANVSRIEQYAACAFAHFLQYGLKLQNIQEPEFNNISFGNIMHEALRYFGEEMKKHRKEYPHWQIDAEDAEGRAFRDSVCESAVEKAVNDFFPDDDEENGRKNAFKKSIRYLLDYAVDAMTKQLSVGNYEPEAFEKKFEYLVDSCVVNGRIDRYDLATAEDELGNLKTYVKVIDYKSSTEDHKVDLNELYYGLSLQLGVYLNAITRILKENGYEAEPAAILYYGYLPKETDGSDKEGAEEAEKLKTAMPKGAIKSDKTMKLLDRPFYEAFESSEKAKSDYYHLSGANGVLMETADGIDAEVFEHIGAFTEYKMKKLSTGIMNGDVEIAPYQLGKENACEYCDYKSICNINSRNDGSKPKLLKNKNKEDLEYGIKNCIDT